MKNILFGIFLLGLVSCSSSCVKKDTVNPNPIVDAGPESSDFPDVHVDKRTHVAGDTWEFYLPSQEWALELIDGSPDTVYFNKKDQNLVAFVKEPVDITLQEYVLFAIRSLKESGMQLISTTNGLKINDVNYTLLEAGQGRVRLYQWITVQNKVGYSLSCGGPSELENTQKDLCNTIGITLKVK